MNRQRKVVITTTYNEMGIIIDTKAEELGSSAQPKNVPSRKGVFIPDITVEMFRNASLEGIEELLASGEMEDVSLPSAQPEDYTELKREFLQMASYIDVLLECSDVQKETMMGFISRLSQYMPWTERD